MPSVQDVVQDVFASRKEAPAKGVCQECALVTRSKSESRCCVSVAGGLDGVAASACIKDQLNFTPHPLSFLPDHCVYSGQRKHYYSRMRILVQLRCSPSTSGRKSMEYRGQNQLTCRASPTEAHDTPSSYAFHDRQELQ